MKGCDENEVVVQRARLLSVILGQRSGNFKSNKGIMGKMITRMEQRYFSKSCLLPCSLRSQRIANPRLKMGFAIFKLCPPTAQCKAKFT